MKILLALIMFSEIAQASECFSDEKFKYKRYKKNFFLIYDEREKSMVVNEITDRVKKNWKPIDCRVITSSKIKALIEEKDNTCVFSKVNRAQVGKLLFRVVNLSSENKLTLEVNGRKEVLGEGRFLAHYREQACVNRVD